MAQSIGSGESERCQELPPDIPDYRIDDTVQASLQEASVNKRSAESQTDNATMINNYTQTDEDQCAILKQILEKVSGLEKQVQDMQLQLSRQTMSIHVNDTPSLVSSALQTVNDPYDFEASEIPFSATIPTTSASMSQTPTSRHYTAGAPTTRLFASPRCQPRTVMNELGFWKLLPSEVLNNDIHSVIERARNKLPSDMCNSELSTSKLEELKASCLNQRALFAKNLVHNYVTVGELYNRNVNGRNSTGQPKERINSVQIQYVRDQTFKLFPCLPSESKTAWSECVKAIDKGNLYLFAQIGKKFDIGPIMDYF